MRRKAREWLVPGGQPRPLQGLVVRVCHRGDHRAVERSEVAKVLEPHHAGADDPVPNLIHTCRRLRRWKTSSMQGRASSGSPGLTVGPLAFGCWRFTHEHIRDAGPLSMQHWQTACGSSTPPTYTASTGAAPASARARPCSAECSATRRNSATRSCSRPRGDPSSGPLRQQHGRTPPRVRGVAPPARSRHHRPVPGSSTGSLRAPRGRRRRPVGTTGRRQDPRDRHLELHARAARRAPRLSR